MKFYGQFTPPVDQFIFERYFPDLNIKGVFVECGSYDGLVDSSCKFFEEFAGWTGFNIEAVPHIFSRLVENRPNSVNINAALSDKVGIAKFRHAIHPTHGTDFGNGSLNHSDVHLKDLADQNCTFEEFDVETLTWIELVRKHNIKSVDLFVLDVEGHELSVLDGMSESSVLPSVICIEFGHISFQDIVERLFKLGYLYDIHSNANAYFVRTDMAAIFALRATTIKTEQRQLSLLEQQLAALHDEQRKLIEERDKAVERFDRLIKRRWSTLGRKLGVL